MRLNSLHRMMKNAIHSLNLKSRNAEVTAFSSEIDSNRGIIMLALITPVIAKKILDAPLSDNELVFPNRTRLVDGTNTSLGQHSLPGQIFVDDLTGEVVEIQIDH